MGESSVFTIQLNKFFGIGVSFEMWFADNKKVPIVNISLPLVLFSIYFRKSCCNDWFSFSNYLIR